MAENWPQAALVLDALGEPSAPFCRDPPPTSSSDAPSERGGETSDLSLSIQHITAASSSWFPPFSTIPRDQKARMHL